MSRLNLLEETRYEKLPVTVFADKLTAAQSVARRIADLVQNHTAAGKKTILGLATGATPIAVYQELVRLYQQEGLSFKNVVTFNLDEYFPMDSHAVQSYRVFMNENLFNHIDIEAANIHIPNGELKEEDVAAFCLDYEKKITSYGGLDLQILGIGRTGHIGFNEPGSAPNSGCRLVSLDELTRSDAAHDFGGKSNVPAKAITMGIGTIFKAREIILMAWGEKKAFIIKKAVEGEMSSDVPATYLQLADNVEFVVDAAAAGNLTRFNMPWLVKDCTWSDQLIKKAVIWLAKTLNKPILKLTEDDYNNHGMAQLATSKGPVYNININIFNKLQHTITGWPGGKPNADESQRPERAEPAKKRVMVFSPHPDDDVISMGGTFIRLADQQHDVHVVYQTSGNSAVWDDDALRFVEFTLDFSKSQNLYNEKLEEIYQAMRKFISNKQPNEKDISEVEAVKGFIRKGEAIAGARFVGLNDAHIHFQNLPFYDLRKTSHEVSYEADIQQTIALLQQVKPHQIYSAGDFADPHGTHKTCFDIIHESLKRLAISEKWVKDCWVWLYRGAWHEFETEDIEMCVPLSPKEVERKRLAIFKHQSQKDRPVFPGEDAREFWVRAEDRTSETAKIYNKLGLAEYEAMEAFVRFKY
jgi:glucosamine-6-phosphate deaminase